ncbi:histidine kinase dimerization/phosphoacceptor domain-containing protein [Nonomuraea endophytica]|uniref:histidine kinase dimerization/phosphoacceptor domain-containing protein n=1 Tax=Nonomuraea endophytica TaxID=714136 RepID=UPI0037C5B01F
MDWGFGLAGRGVGVRLTDPAPFWWLLVLVVLYGLAVRKVAEITLLAAGTAVAATVLMIALRGHDLRTVAGATLVTTGLAAAAWAMGRARRRRTARSRALAFHRAGRHALPGFAADTEGLRLATELHDTLVHRLTSIIVATSAALRLGEREQLAQAVRNAAESGREPLTPHHPAPGDMTEMDALVAAWPKRELTYSRRSGGTVRVWLPT